MVIKPAGTDTHTKMKVFTLDNLYLWSQIGVVLMGLAVFITGKLVNDRETEKSDRLTRELAEQRQKTEEQRTTTAKLDKDVADARTRQAEAETKLEEVRKRQERRGANWTKFTEALNGKPTCELEIFCQPNDDEAYSLASIMSLMLATAGWPLVQPVPIPDSIGKQPPTKMISDGKVVDMPLKGQEIFKKMFEAYPPVVRAGAGGGALGSFSFGIFVVANKDLCDWQKLDSATPAGALVNALNAVGLNAGVGPPNNELPDNKLRIIVAAKP